MDKNIPSRKYSDVNSEVLTEDGGNNHHPGLPNGITTMSRETYYQMMQFALSIQQDLTIAPAIKGLILMMWTFIRHTAFPQLINPRELERQRSIVVSGIPEFLGKPSVSCKADRQAAENILDTLRIQCPIITAYRLGPKRRDKSRPLKIVLPSSGHHKDVLGRAAKLREIPDYENVFIRPALTHRQLKSDSKQRDICRFLNQRGHSVVVYSNVICTRTDPPIPVDLSKFPELAEM
uniref:Uncharacterized protein n=1 Tax=Panagrolaimus sp. PS1159 TaxID=55785 RepID=A0AC35EXQ7_9BILA